MPWRREAWCTMQALSRWGGTPSQTTSALGHGGLEASIPECDSCHLVGLLRHALGQTQVGRAEGKGDGDTAVV